MGILTTNPGCPSRDWLNPHLGYLKTSRACSKAGTWFKQQNHEQNIIDGRRLLGRELNRLAVRDLSYDKLSEYFHLNSNDDMLIAIGRGDINPAQIAGAVYKLVEKPQKEAAVSKAPERKPRTSDGGDTWATQSGNSELQSGISFVDAQTGWIVGDRGMILHLDLDHRRRRDRAGKRAAPNLIHPGDQGIALREGKRFGGVIRAGHGPKSHSAPVNAKGP